MEYIRAAPLTNIGGLAVTGFEDLRDPEGRFGSIKGGTDAASRNVLIFRCGDQAKFVLRPSGTEPKAKIYVEACSAPRPADMTNEQWRRSCQDVADLAKRLGAEFARLVLAKIGLDAPPGSV